METTIAVKESTIQLLTQLKNRLKARSMDEVIIEMARKTEGLSKSRFGSQPSLKLFKKEERANFREL
ncbi:MAG: hypothetical protein AABX07_02470 [Nanoarchaeota archaeon]